HCPGRRFLESWNVPFAICHLPFAIGHVACVIPLSESQRRAHRSAMPLIGYFKGQPTESVINSSWGQIVREGQGLAFFYLKYRTQVVSVPTSSMDANLVFNEATSNFQAVTIQGQ